MKITRTLTTAAAALALAGTGVATGTAQAATASHPSALHRLEGAIVDGATFGIDGRTYRAAEVPATYNPAPGYARTCRAFARWQAAGIPTGQQTRTLARDALSLGASLPAQVLYSDVSRLLLSVQAHTSGGNAAARAAHDCHLPSPR